MSDKQILKLNFHGDPNVGLHGVATDKFCLIGRSAREHEVKEIESALKVPVIQVGLYGTDLIGIFASANSEKVILPEIIYDSELKILREKLKKIGVEVEIIKTEHTAFGNNIILNDKAGVVSKIYDKKTFEQIKKAFPKVKFEQMELEGLSVVGSLGAVTARGGLFSPNISEDDIKKIETLFGFEIGLGTVNMGNPFVSSGIIANSNGFIIGSSSSGYEMSRAFESLGFGFSA